MQDFDPSIGDGELEHGGLCIGRDQGPMAFYRVAGWQGRNAEIEGRLSSKPDMMANVRNWGA